MRPIILVPAALLAAATDLLTINGSAQPPAPAIERTPSGISSIRADPAQARSSIWTPARLRDVEAAPLPVLDPDAVRAAFSAQRSSPGTSGATPASASSAGLGRRSGNVRSYPLTQVGQLFFNTNKDKPGWGNVCTAQFIDEDVILTASHCVQDDTPPYAYHKNFLFSLQYVRGSFDRQYGWKCVANKTAWAQRSQSRWLYDYAMLKLDGKSEVGWFGLAWGWAGQYHRATKIGYPNGDFKGEVIQVDAGPLSVKDGLVELRHGNRHVQHGSSGGGYVGDYSTNQNGDDNHIISSESFSPGGEAGETSGIGYGPYYTEEIFSLFKYANAGCREP